MRYDHDNLIDSTNPKGDSAWVKYYGDEHKDKYAWTHSAKNATVFEIETQADLDKIISDIKSEWRAHNHLIYPDMKVIVLDMEGKPVDAADIQGWERWGEEWDQS